jgi:HD-GYP domain-containing protein (c-di-GMP phosphodiesterase class II)
MEPAMLENILNIGTILSTEKDAEKLYEIILKAAMDFTHADAGTLYRLMDDKQLSFDIIHTRSKGVHIGGKSGRPILLAPIELFLPDGTPDHSRIVCHAVHTHETVQIDDVYASTRFDFSGTHAFDKQNDYLSKSVLAVPLRTPDGETIGALQLLNPLDESGVIRSFTIEEQAVVRSLASQMAVALANRILIDAQAALFDSMIQLINSAIDDKSPYTGGHCSRVPQLTLMMADAVNRCRQGPLADFEMTTEDRAELRVAGFLHDCGKISTPVHVVDKATKLEAIHDRIALVELRFELVIKEIEIALLKGELSPDLAQQKRQQALDNVEFLKKSNTGSESMRDEHVQRIAQITQQYGWVDTKGVAQAAITADEAKNLSIRYGTLNNEEREIINHHIVLTINLLEQLPWPKHLRNVPEYAGGHHEKMDGKGYPKGLTRDQMSVQARCMGIADIFEALTASDRPYKKAKTLSESLKIMGSMKLGQHIDPDLFDVFIWEKVYLQYAHVYLSAEQIDEVDVTQIPGYVAPPEGYVAVSA